MVPFSSWKDMPVKTRRRRRTDDLVSVIGAGSDGSKQKTRIKRGNTTKLANKLRDQLNFVPFQDPSQEFSVTRAYWQHLFYSLINP